MGFFKKITDSIGFSFTLMLVGVLLPMAAWGFSALLSYSLAHLGSASVFIGALTWNNIWPIMAIAAASLLVIGFIIDVIRCIVKGIKSKKKTEKGIDVKEKDSKEMTKEKENLKSNENSKANDIINIENTFNKSIKKGSKKNNSVCIESNKNIKNKKITSGKEILKLDDRNKQNVYNNKDTSRVRNKDVKITDYQEKNDKNIKI